MAQHPQEIIPILDKGGNLDMLYTALDYPHYPLCVLEISPVKLKQFIG